MPTCHGSRTEEIAMGAEAGADQFKSVFHDTVDQYKVRFDMAVTVSDELTFKRMVMERWRKRLLGAKQIDHAVIFSRLLPRLTASLRSRENCFVKMRLSMVVNPPSPMQL